MPKIKKYYKESTTLNVIPIVNQEECTKTYENIHPITDNMICVGNKERRKMICRCDNGGPLMCICPGHNMRLTGMVSWSQGCADPNYPGVYSRVSAVREWIEQKTGISYQE